MAHAVAGCTVDPALQGAAKTAAATVLNTVAHVSELRDEMLGEDVFRVSRSTG